MLLHNRFFFFSWQGTRVKPVHLKCRYLMKIGQKTTTPSQEICYFFFAFMMLFILLVIDTAFRPINSGLLDRHCLASLSDIPTRFLIFSEKYVSIISLSLIVHFFLPPELGVLKRPSENIEERPSYGQCSRNIKIQTTRNKP